MHYKTSASCNSGHLVHYTDALMYLGTHLPGHPLGLQQTKKLILGVLHKLTAELPITVFVLSVSHLPLCWAFTHLTNMQQPYRKQIAQDILIKLLNILM